MRVFLSYGHDEHASLVLRVKRDLETHGHEVWFDLDRLKPGSDWEQYIEDGFEHVSMKPGQGRFVLFMTPHSVGRPNGYCLNELAKAWYRNLDIIPVKLAEVEPPLSICGIQYLDMSDCVPVDDRQEKYKSKFVQLLTAIEQNRLDLQGAQARLFSYLNPLSYESEISEHVRRFTGRKWVMEELERWLGQPGRRVFWITGDAGVGKSALAAWLAAHRPEIAAFHACRYGNSDRVNARKVLSSIAYQLSTQVEGYQYRLNASNLDTVKGEPSAAAVFERLFVAPLSYQPFMPRKPVVILIDALDEATERGKNELAEIIATEFRKTPEWLRLIVTSRPHEAVVKYRLQALDPWKLDAGRTENIDDIREYLERELRPLGTDGEPSKQTLDRIVEKSEGLFLYADWVRDGFEKGELSFSEVEIFPQGLSGIYANFFPRYFPNTNKYGRTYRSTIEAICAAREPLNLNYLSQLFGWTTYQRIEITGALGSLFPISDNRIRPFHQSIRDWLTNEKTAVNYFVSVDSGHHRLASYGWKQYTDGVAQMDVYSVIHLPAHLAASGWNDRLSVLLLDFHWMQLKLEETDVWSLLADFDRITPDKTLRAVRDALRRSARHIVESKRALFPLLASRVDAGTDPRLRAMLDSGAQHADRPCLVPLTPGLLQEQTLVATFDNRGIPQWISFLGLGDEFVTAVDDRLVIRDFWTGVVRTSLDASGRIVAAASSADGSRIAVATGSGVRIWQTQSGAVEAEFPEDGDAIKAIALDKTGAVVSILTPHSFVRRQIPTGEILSQRDWNVPVDAKYEVSNSWLIFRTDDEPFYTITAQSIDDSTVAFLVRRDIGNFPEAFHISPDESALLIAGMNFDNHRTAVESMSFPSGQSRTTLLSEPDRDFKRIAMHLDGRRLLTASEGGIDLWHVNSRQEERLGRLLSMISGNGEFAVQIEGFRLQLIGRSWEHTLELGHEFSELERLGLDYRGRYCAIAAKSNDLVVISLFDIHLKDRCAAFDLGKFQPFISCLAVAPDAKHIFACTYGARYVLSTAPDRSSAICSALFSQDGSERHDLKGRTDKVVAAAFATREPRLYTASGDRTIRAWDTTTCELQWSLEVAGRPAAIALSHDDRRIACCFDDHTVALHDTSRGEIITKIATHDTCCVALGGDSRFLWTGSSSGTVSVWDIKTQTCLTFLNLGTSIQSVGVDDQLVVSASDGSGRLHRMRLLE